MKYLVLKLKVEKSKICFSLIALTIIELPFKIKLETDLSN